MDKLIALLKQYDGLLTEEDLRLYLSSVSILKDANGGWGEVTVVFKGGEAKETSTVLTLRSPKKVKDEITQRNGGDITGGPKLWHDLSN